MATLSPVTLRRPCACVEQLKKAGVEVDSFVEQGVPHSYNVILNDSPQTIRFKDLRDKAVKQMFK